MRNKFVTTSNVARFLAAFTALEERGAGEACLMVIDGYPGHGKTSVTDWWATQHDAVFIRAKAEWTPRWMMQELLEVMSIVPRHSFQDRFKQAIDGLMERHRQAVIERRPFAVIVDEVDHISRNTKILETLRDLSDLLEIPFVFVGMGKVRANLTRFPQIASRVGQYVEFQPANRADVGKLVSELCEVEVAEDLVEFLHRVSKGRIREVKEGLMAIERFGKHNAEKVTCKSMTGKVLLNSRENGRPIKVEA